jgi:Mrp family chromosome partitioning ATPase
VVEPRLSDSPPGRTESPPDVSAGRGILASLRAHPLLIAFEGLIALLAALVFLQAREPTYEATAQILVSPLPEFEDSLPQIPLIRSAPDRARVIQTAANLVDSPEAAALAAKRLGPDWTPGRVASMVDVLPEGESDVLAVTASADDGRVAARVATEFARAAIDVRGRFVQSRVEKAIADTESELRAEPDADSATATRLAEKLADLKSIRGAGDPTLSLSRPADVPSSPVGLPDPVLAVLALFFGLAAGVAVALVVDMLRSPTVATPSHAVALTGLPVLARVPGLSFWERIRRSPQQPLRPGSVIALRKLQHQLATRRSILLVGGSAGDGVTTCAADLGSTLARAGHDVLVVDLDARDPKLATRLGAADPPALASLAARDSWTSALVSVPRVPGLRLAAVGRQGAFGIPDEVAATLPKMLSAAAERFEYVVVDAPPIADSAEALRVAAGVDAVLLVVRPGNTRVVELESALDLMERAGGRPAGLLVVGGPAARSEPIAAEAAPEPAPGAAPVEERSRPRAGKRTARLRDETGRALGKK